jgi:hypothetical protein
MILLIPVLTLFTGSVTLASTCAKMAAGAECGVMCNARAKSMMATPHYGWDNQADGCSKRAGGCGHRCNKGQTGKGGQKGKDGCASCADCPLCCLVTFKPFFQWEVNRQITIIDYTVMSDNNLSDYFQQHWKPPNGSFLSWFQQTFFHRLNYSQ